MDDKYKLVKAYQEDNNIRKSFNDLSKSTFELDFEDWYQNGYWKDNYIPYSILDKNKVVANVSVSPMEFVHEGKCLNLIQIGTVMTEKSYRNQGLVRRIFKEIELDYKDKVDGCFLFGSDSVIEFYPKFGYIKSKEFEYFKDVTNNNEMIAVNVDVNKDRTDLEEAIKSSSTQSGLWLRNNMELTMFYVTKFMSNSVYFIDNIGAYVIADLNEETLYLHQIFALKEIDIDEVISAFGKDVKKVILGFTPISKEGYEHRYVYREDNTFFIKGTSLEIIEKNKLRIPTLAHT